MPIKGIISSINISTNKPIADNIKFSGISKGFIDESLYYNSIKVKQLPREAETPKLYLKVDTYNIPGVTHLFIKGLEGKVLEEEMEGLVAYFLKRPLLTTNYNNTLFNEWTKVYMMKWTFDKTNDIRILNRMIEQADTLLRYRDDNYGKYKTLIKNEYTEFTKGWSHFRGLCYVDNEPTKKALGIADIGTGINFHAGVALTIASHPEIWNNSFEGKTYKEIALEMLEDVHENWNYIIKYYYDKKTNLLYSPKYASEPEGVVPQWNRLFPLMASGNILVDASELLNIKDDRINKIDSILKALFKHFWDNARIEKYEGKDVVYYPYGVYRLKSNPEHTEDINHMGFDSRAIRVFHHSGRYWNEEQTKLLSNLMCYRMIKDDKGSFASRQNSEKIIKNYDYSGSLPDLMWFAEFEPQLKDKLLKYSVDVMENRNTMDGRVVFNILHYRALKYGIE